MTFVALWPVLSPHAAEGPRLPKVKDFHLNTAIVRNAEAAAGIVTPERPEYQRLAKQIQQTVKERSGVELPLILDTEADEGPAEMNAILLGNLMTNRLTAKLYCMESLDVDAAWPGKGGYLLQTVHNPFGDGRNFVSLGGSDFDGVRASAEMFLAKLKPGKDISVGSLFELKAASKVPDPISDDYIGRTIRGMKGKGYRVVAGRATSFGSTVRKYRTPGYAKLFRKTIEVLWEEMDQLKVCDDLRTAKFLPIIWDNIEESDQFTDDDRELISNFMYVHAHKVPYAHRQVKASARPHGNNWNARGSYIAGLYFSKYYPDLEIGKRIMARMDRYYKGDLVHWKVSEDCPGYGDITLRANLFYARTRQDMSYFESGNVRKVADYDMLITTNLGNVSGIGDASGLRYRYAVTVLPMAAWYYRDGSYLWWYRHCKGGTGRFMVDDLEVKPPTRLLGVKAYPLDQWIYDRKPARRMPMEKCFDKMSFRAGFEPDQQYLCLSGFSYGFHSHPDGNAIVSFTDNGHTFLFDDGYMVPEMSEHNTVVIYRDGRGGSLPELVQIDHQADFKTVGFSATSFSGYNGARWRRNIIWAKERYFLVVDEIEAEQDAEFACQCFWRTMGDVQLNGRELTADQDGQVMHLLNLSGATQSVKECHAKHPFGRKLVQTVPAKLQKGEKVVITSLFYVRGPDEPAVSVETPAPGVALIRRNGELALAGVGPCSAIPGMDINVPLFYLSSTGSHVVGSDRPAPSLQGREGTLAELFVKCQRARLAEEKASLAAGAVNVKSLWTYGDFDLFVNHATKKGVTVSSSVEALPPEESYPGSRGLAKIIGPSANVMFPTGKNVTVTIDLTEPCSLRRVTIRSRQLLTFRGGCGVSKMVVEMSNDAFKRDVRLFGQRDEKTVPPLNRMVEYHIEAPAAQARYVRFRFEPLTPDRHVYIDSVALEGLASPAERRRRGYIIQSMDTCDLDGDGQAETIVGGSDLCVYALSPSGKRLWKSEVGGRIYQLDAADLDGDWRGEVVVASADRRLYCFNADGSTKWDVAPPPRTYARAHYRGVLPFTGALKIVFTTDIENDGKREIVVGASNWRTYCYSHNGELLWDECNWAHQPTCGDAYDLDGDGVKEIVMGNDYSSAHVYDGKTGKIRLTVPMTGHAGPSALAAGDINGDGTGDLVVGDRMGQITFCYPWNVARAQRQSLRVGAPITFVKLADLDGDAVREAIVGSANGYLYVFGGTKAVLWQTNVGEVPRDLAATDLDGDGKPELLVACEDNKLHVYNGPGNEIASFAAGGWVRHVRTGELDGKVETSEFAVASDDGTVTALSYAATK